MDENKTRIEMNTHLNWFELNMDIIAYCILKTWPTTVSSVQRLYYTLKTENISNFFFSTFVYFTENQHKMC